MKRISANFKIFRVSGLSELFRSVKSVFLKKKTINFSPYQELLNRKSGIEIGGPSSFFQEQIPIYQIIESLDGVNFSSSTIWEGEILEGENYNYGTGKRGYQFICEATNLKRIEPGKYDFVLSCNNLEHIANPFRALTEWLRILKPEGLLLLVLPNKKRNFDHRRSITGFDHLIKDFENNTSEEDLTHLDEILILHDLSLDRPAGDFRNFRERSFNNFHNRCLHHHVFDMDLLKKIFIYFNIEVLSEDCTKADFIILGRKT